MSRVGLVALAVGSGSGQWAVAVAVAVGKRPSLLLLRPCWVGLPMDQAH